MRRALLWCGGVFLGLSAVAIPSAGPALYLHATGRGYSSEWVGVAVLGAALALVVQGGVIAAAAAGCFARALGPGSSSPNVGRRTLTIAGVLFLLGAVRPFFLAHDTLETLQVMESVPERNWPGVSEDLLRQIRVARTFGILYGLVGVALLVAPAVLRSRGWPSGRPRNRRGGGLVIAGLACSGLGVLIEWGNGMTGEAYSELMTGVASVVVLAGTVLAVAGSVAAVVGKLQRSDGAERGF